jgi:hypothetical protein
MANFDTLSGLASGAMIVDLNISVYSGRKKDRKTQAEVTEAKSSASRKAASVYKSLFAECRELEAVNKYQSEIRATHYRLTKPWTDFGSRILMTALLQDYCDKMDEHEAEFNRLVGTFLDKYEALVSAAAFQLGDLFDRSEYPPRSVVATKFRISRDMSPLPTAGDWRIDLDSEKQRELVKQYEKRIQKQIEGVQLDNWEKLYTALRHMSNKLEDKVGDDGEKKAKKLYESMLEQSEDLCELLKVMNITNDPAMERARVGLCNAIAGVNIKDLRTSEGQRILTKQKVDAVLDAFDWGDADDGDSADALQCDGDE